MSNTYKPKPQVGPYHLHQKGKDSTMLYGTYYEKSVWLPFDDTAERMIRVWLPPGYGEEGKRFPVIYFSDGQNLVDRELSAYGDWHLDRVMQRLIDENFTPAILVGIDCPKSPSRRANELNPPYPPKNRFRLYSGPKGPYANQYVDYIAHTLKPEIDKLFATKPELMSTGIGGSSMGGIMSFYAYMTYPDVFGLSLAFSIPFFAYTKKRWKELLEEWHLDPKSPRKLVMWVGGKGFERKFTSGNKWMAKYLQSQGFSSSNFLFMQNTALPHHEESWATYSYDALKFLLKDIH